MNGLHVEQWTISVESYIYKLLYFVQVIAKFLMKLVHKTKRGEEVFIEFVLLGQSHLNSKVTSTKAHVLNQYDNKTVEPMSHCFQSS